MKDLVKMPGKFYYLWDDKTDTQYIIRELGKGIFTHYDVYFEKDTNLLYLGNFTEEQFIINFIKGEHNHE